MKRVEKYSPKQKIEMKIESILDGEKNRGKILISHSMKMRRFFKLIKFKLY
jgi:hypothetical protein